MLADASFRADPYPYYRMLHAIDPVFRADDLFGLTAWIVTGHAVATQVLKSRAFGKEAHEILSPEALALIPQENARIGARPRKSMLFRDPPAHTRLRGLVSQAFTPRTVERLRPRIEALAQELLAGAEARGGEVDLIREFAFPLPVTVIAELLGVPAEDRDRFKAWSTDLTLSLDLLPDPTDLAKVAAAVDGLNAYLSEVIEARRREPRDDLISALVKAQADGDRLTMSELLGTCRLLLTAGHETTVNLIGNGFLALCRHPEARARLAAEPSRLEPALEEILRYDSPVQTTLRFALEDAPLGDRTAARGDLVVVLQGAANRDPEVFSDPDRLDLARPNAAAHLAFGAGIHYCLGAALARLEGSIALRVLLDRPGLRVASEDLSWRKSLVLRGLEALPVRF